MNTLETNGSQLTDELTSTRHRRGNVARLPKETRDKINSMLDDGLEYNEIINRLGAEGKHLQPSNLTHWKQGGYQDYLRAQDWRERMTIMCDRFLDPAASDPIQLATGALHTAMIQVCELMDKITHTKPDESDPKDFIGITNSLSRISRSIVIISEYRDALQKLKTANGTSTEAQVKARQDMLDKMDQLFGIRPAKAIDQIFGPAPGSATAPLAPAN